MKVDAAGLVAAAKRLITAVEGLGESSGVPHPPLGADPASVGAAGRLTTVGAEVSAALVAHVSALVASVEHLTGAAFTYLDADERNAAAIAALDGRMAGGATLAGSAPPAPPIPADVRAPMPPPAGMVPEAISVAAHSGTPGGGEAFISAWAQAAGEARDGAAAIRSAVAYLPETLNGPWSTPAVSRHLLFFADGLDHYADRAHKLASQAKAYAANHSQALEDIPTPQQFTAADNRIQTIAYANTASGGKWAVPLANAVAERSQLDERALRGYTGYHERTDAVTAGDDDHPGTIGQGLPADPAVGAGSGQPDPSAEALSPETGGELASMLPQLMPALLGAAGGLVGGVIGAVTKVPGSLMQAGTQGLGAATQGLSGLAQPKMDAPDPGTGKPNPNSGDSGDPNGAGDGGDAPTTPAGGDGVPELGVAPSTGGPPTPAIAPVGATEGPGPAPASSGSAGMAPMGMPMGGLGGAPGGGGPGGKAEVGRQRKIQPREIPHTEDVTGRVDTNRLLVAAAASHRDRNPEPPNDDNPPDAAAPIVRRLVTRRPKEPS